MSNLKIAKQHYNEKSLFRYNHVVNGQFEICQRGTSQTIDGYGSVDSWKSVHTSGVTKTFSRQNFIAGAVYPDGTPCPKYYGRTVISNAGNASSDYVILTTIINDVIRLATRPITVKFKAKANAAKKMCVELAQAFDSPNGGSAQVNFYTTTLNLTTNWQEFTVKATCPSVIGKIVGKSAWTAIRFWFSAGSNFADRTGAMGIQTGTFDVADVILMEGHEDSLVPIPRSYEEEFFLCQESLEIIPFALIRHITSVNLGGTGQVRLEFQAEKSFIPAIEVYTTRALTTPGFLCNGSLIKSLTDLEYYLSTTDIRINNKTALPNLYDYGEGVVVISAEL